MRSLSLDNIEHFMFLAVIAIKQSLNEVAPRQAVRPGFCIPVVDELTWPPFLNSFLSMNSLNISSPKTAPHLPSLHPIKY